MNVSNSLSNSSAVFSFFGSGARGALGRVPRLAPRGAGRVREFFEPNLQARRVKEYQTSSNISFTMLLVPSVDLLVKFAQEEVVSQPC